MRRVSRIRKVATLVSSLTLGSALLMYADWRAPARSAASEEGGPEKDADDGLADVPFLAPGTKSAIGLGGGAPGGSRWRSNRTGPAPLPDDEPEK